MIKVCKTALEGVLLVKPQVFLDFRGCYVETYNEEMYRERGIGIKFVQDDISVSKKHVLRGIHGDQNTWKLISCMHGKFYFVVLNCDPGSSQFGKWLSLELSAKNRLQVLVPPKFGNGHLVLSRTAVFHYKQSTYYSGAEKQFTVRWNDKRFKIDWPVSTPILSVRDGGRYGK